MVADDVDATRAGGFASAHFRCAPGDTESRPTCNIADVGAALLPIGDTGRLVADGGDTTMMLGAGEFTAIRRVEPMPDVSNDQNLWMSLGEGA
ncbi:hypothetical protein Y900_004255 [Mycolicibacterium aromaticivorans JS19b1 = JCM 16368]|uniref:Uncharacterized protein n=1 Tax=Mycolicibacterium aromaticivorans JS19b1 = JCM 16368 TaxID=1440774 RepID=A0A064CEQ8_9MYCO|nr:hypothetical protein Y900_004255 [Mycolicibacterium aromaticivorans JS19b1 = JCM 16368]